MVFKHTLTLVRRYKYEGLLLAWIIDLYIGVFINDMGLYQRYIWPANMLMLGLASVGVFDDKERLKQRIKNFLFGLVMILPIVFPFFSISPTLRLFFAQPIAYSSALFLSRSFSSWFAPVTLI